MFHTPRFTLCALRSTSPTPLCFLSASYIFSIPYSRFYASPQNKNRPQRGGICYELSSQETTQFWLATRSVRDRVDGHRNRVRREVHANAVAISGVGVGDVSGGVHSRTQGERNSVSSSNHVSQRVHADGEGLGGSVGNSVPSGAQVEGEGTGAAARASGAGRSGSVVRAEGQGSIVIQRNIGAGGSARRVVGREGRSRERARDRDLHGLQEHIRTIRVSREGNGGQVFRSVLAAARGGTKSSRGNGEFAAKDGLGVASGVRQDVRHRIVRRVSERGHESGSGGVFRGGRDNEGAGGVVRGSARSIVRHIALKGDEFRAGLRDHERARKVEYIVVARTRGRSREVGGSRSRGDATQEGGAIVEAQVSETGLGRGGGSNFLEDNHVGDFDVLDVRSLREVKGSQLVAGGAHDELRSRNSRRVTSDREGRGATNGDSLASSRAAAHGAVGDSASSSATSQSAGGAGLGRSVGRNISVHIDDHSLTSRNGERSTREGVRSVRAKSGVSVSKLGGTDLNRQVLIVRVRAGAGLNSEVRDAHAFSRRGSKSVRTDPRSRLVLGEGLSADRGVRSSSQSVRRERQRATGSGSRAVSLAGSQTLEVVGVGQQRASDGREGRSGLDITLQGQHASGVRRDDVVDRRRAVTETVHSASRSGGRERVVGASDRVSQGSHGGTNLVTGVIDYGNVFDFVIPTGAGVVGVQRNLEAKPLHLYGLASRIDLELRQGDIGLSLRDVAGRSVRGHRDRQLSLLDADRSASSAVHGNRDRRVVLAVDGIHIKGVQDLELEAEARGTHHVGVNLHVGVSSVQLDRGSEIEVDVAVRINRRNGGTNLGAVHEELHVLDVALVRGTSHAELQRIEVNRGVRNVSSPLGDENVLGTSKHGSADSGRSDRQSGESRVRNGRHGHSVTHEREGTVDGSSGVRSVNSSDIASRVDLERDGVSSETAGSINREPYLPGLASHYGQAKVREGDHAARERNVLGNDFAVFHQVSAGDAAVSNNAALSEFDLINSDAARGSGSEIHSQNLNAGSAAKKSSSGRVVGSQAHGQTVSGNSSASGTASGSASGTTGGLRVQVSARFRTNVTGSRGNADGLLPRNDSSFGHSAKETGRSSDLKVTASDQHLLEGRYSLSFATKGEVRGKRVGRRSGRTTSRELRLQRLDLSQKRRDLGLQVRSGLSKRRRSSANEAHESGHGEHYRSKSFRHLWIN